MDINRGGASGQSGLKCLKSIAKPKADGNRGNNGSRHSGGGSSSSGGGSGRGGRRWSRQGESAASFIPSIISPYPFISSSSKTLADVREDMVSES